MTTNREKLEQLAWNQRLDLRDVDSHATYKGCPSCGSQDFHAGYDGCGPWMCRTCGSSFKESARMPKPCYECGKAWDAGMATAILEYHHINICGECLDKGSQHSENDNECWNE